MIKLTETYDENYFEKGVATGVSGYTNYRFLPNYVIPIANHLVNKYPDASFLDYGCAKGFLVKALRLFNVEAYGYDVSKYAIKTADKDIKDLLTNDKEIWKKHRVNYVIAKDVLEHIPPKDLKKELKYIHEVCLDGAIVIVPLGDKGVFRIREYELDKTHINKEDECWWVKQFNNAGFDLQEFYYTLDGYKDNWKNVNPYGNGIFFLKKVNK